MVAMVQYLFKRIVWFTYIHTFAYIQQKYFSLLNDWVFSLASSHKSCHTKQRYSHDIISINFSAYKLFREYLLSRCSFKKKGCILKIQIRTMQQLYAHILIHTCGSLFPVVSMAASTSYLSTSLVSFPLRIIDTLSMIWLKLFTYVYTHIYIRTQLHTPT